MAVPAYYSSIFPRSRWYTENKSPEFIQRKDGWYLLISGCLASNPFLTATYVLLVSSLFHTTCSFGGRIVLGIYLCLQKQTGATASLPYPVKSEGVRPWPNPGQSDPLDLEKMSQGCQAVWHPPTCIPAHMFLWHNVQAPPPRGGSLCSFALNLVGSRESTENGKGDCHKRHWLKPPPRLLGLLTLHEDTQATPQRDLLEQELRPPAHDQLVS